MHSKLIIIGSGPAGYTAGIYAARAMLNPLLFKGSQPGGQLTITTDVENWPGNEVIQGPDLMKNMEEHAKATGVNIIDDHVMEIQVDEQPFVIKSDKKKRYTANSICCLSLIAD